MTETVVEWTQTVQVVVEVKKLAEIFAHMTDEQQAQFFIEAAAISATWGWKAEGQWIGVGGHLRNCECSTEGARELIRNIAYELEHSTDGVKV